MSRALPALVASTLLLAACGGSDPEAAPPPLPASPTVTASTTPTPSPPTAPAVTDPLSLPALIQEQYTPSRLTQTSVESRNSAYVRSRVTYQAGDLKVSGVLLKPIGDGPFPAVVLNHGYIDPDVYRPGQGMAREQDRLARRGFVVLHTDYRGHAGSDTPSDPYDMESRLGYARDAIHAVLALKQETYVDPDKVAMMGRSMGGAVTLNALVAQPGLVKAAVIYASVSSVFNENLEHFTRPNRPGQLRRFHQEFGTPQQAPDFYAGLSARTYFDRITEPVLAHHGSVDDTCPPQWAEATQKALQDAGVDSRLVTHRGEGHVFYSAWSASMDSTVEFLRRELGVNSGS